MTREIMYRDALREAIAKMRDENRARARERADESIRNLSVRVPNASFPVGGLSGGNQQKVLFARALAGDPKVLLLDEPTRGVDVGAKAEIYELLRRFTADGGAILAVSGDLPELIGLCDRILVVRGGAIVADVPGHSATEELLLGHALRSESPSKATA